MKKAMILFFAFALFVFATGTVVVSDVPMFPGILVATAYADEPTTNAAPVVAETLFADGSTNTWTAADLQTALGLMNRKYHREQETDAGRAKWHGKQMGQYFIDGEDGKQCRDFVWKERITLPKRVNTHIPYREYGVPSVTRGP